MENQKTNNNRKISVYLTLQIVIVILSVGVGYFGHRFILQYRAEFGLLRQARGILIENSILEIPEETTLEYGMIRGMLNTLDDPYTHFVEPAAHDIQTDQLSGHYAGVGVRLERDLQMNWRVYPLPESPALEAGIQDADQLIYVEEQAITSAMDEVSVTAAIRGPVGETVTITVQRGLEMLTFSIERKTIPIPSVTHHLLADAPQIGMVQINRIAGSTAEEIQTGIEELIAQGAKAIILDLRDNGGGLVEAGVQIARLFLQEGEIMHQQFKDAKVNVFKVEKPGLFTEIPLAVFINSHTASSAEIVAGALKSHQRAYLVGTATHGKTSIQYIFELQDGSSVHVTSGQWWVPGQDFPLEPEFSVINDPTGVEIIGTAITILENSLKP
jgi:carboxyl-terminal processing protease